MENVKSVLEQTAKALSPHIAPSSRMVWETTMEDLGSLVGYKISEGYEAFPIMIPLNPMRGAKQIRNKTSLREYVMIPGLNLVVPSNLAKQLGYSIEKIKGDQYPYKILIATHEMQNHIRPC